MKTKIHLLIAILLSAPWVRGERTDEVILQQGTPTSVVWTLEKKGEKPETQGSAYFEGGMPGTVEAGGPSIWKIPAFDTQGGVRTLTGVSVKYSGGLKANFHADAATTHGRKIEGQEQYVSLVAGIDTTGGTGGNLAGFGYQTQPAGFNDRLFPAGSRQGKLDWNLDFHTEHEGWVLRKAGSATRQETFARIRDGYGVLELSATYRWLPYFELKRDWFGTGTQTFLVDTSTTEWSLPGETVPGVDLLTGGLAYPADALGRRINDLIGLPGYPVGYQPQFQHSYVKVRTGAAEPLEVRVVWHFTQAGDADDKNPYLAAGNFAGPFRKADNGGDEIRYPSVELFEIPGNRELEYPEFHRMIEAEGVAASSGFKLYDWEAANNDDPARGRTIRTHFLWMDADRSGSVSMAEFRSWREFLDVAVDTLDGKDLIGVMPYIGWEKLPAPEDSKAIVVEIGEGGGDPIPKIPVWELLFRYLDSNKDDQLSRTEWLTLYPKKPSTDKGFDAADTDRNTLLSPDEFRIVIENKTGPNALKTLFERRRAFQMMDKNRNNRVSLVEYRLMHLPGTRQQIVNRYWLRMGLRAKAAAAIGLKDWMTVKTLPGINTYREALGIRRKRLLIFDRADSLKGGGNKNGKLDFHEFHFLFRPGTKESEILASWKTATGRKPSDYQMSRSAFVKCVLKGGIVR